MKKFKLNSDEIKLNEEKIEEYIKDCISTNFWDTTKQKYIYLSYSVNKNDNKVVIEIKSEEKFKFDVLKETIDLLEPLYKLTRYGNEDSFLKLNYNIKDNIVIFELSIDYNFETTNIDDLEYRIKNCSSIL